MIREILVIHNSGIVLLGRNYNGTHHFTRDLVGGFISAIGLFSQETFQDDLKEIKFTTSKIIFKRAPHFCVTAIVDHEDETEEIGNLLAEISSQFESQYGPDPTFTGRRGKANYKSFSATIDHLTLPFINFTIKTRKLTVTGALSDPSLSVEDLLSAYKSKRNRLTDILKKKRTK